jgi:hypothetical protein
MRKALIEDQLFDVNILTVLHKEVGDWATPAAACRTFSCADLDSARADAQVPALGAFGSSKDTTPSQIAGLPTLPYEIQPIPTL